MRDSDDFDAPGARHRTGIAVAIAAAAALVTASVWAGGGGVAAAPPLAEQSFAAYGSGTVLGANVLRLGTVQALNAQVGFAGQSFNSKGLAAGIMNELGYAAQPSQPGKNAYGRGAGLEIGLLTPHPADPDPNQILLAGLAQASGPPPSAPVTRQIGPIVIDPIVWANLLRGQAQAVYDPSACAVGQPVSFGQAEVAKVQLLNTGGKRANGEFARPLIETSLPEDRNVGQSRTFSYLKANGDGTFAVVSETHQQVLPVSLLDGAITIELLGEWVLRTTATGKPGGAKVEYAPVGAGPETPVLRLKLLGNPPLTIRLQQLLGPDGLDLSLPGILTLRVGTPPRPIGDDASPQPPAPAAADGTSASAAVDVLRLSVLNLPGLTGLDLRLGHMESSVVAPSGGVRCEIPVSKSVAPDPVVAGGTVTQTITIPSDGGAFAALFDCDLVGIKVEDVVSAKSGSPRFAVTGASNGGTISADRTRVTWANLGPYHPGDPPIVLTVTVDVPADSPPGVLQDVVSVTADLGNCKGGAGGSSLVGGAGLNGSVMGGTATVAGPTVRASIPGAPVAGSGTASTTIAPAVLGETLTRAPAAASAQGGGGGFGSTGFDVAFYVALAGLLMVSGGVTVMASRRWELGLRR